VTNDRPWRLADLSFAPSGNGRERATINGVEVVRENGRYWITTPNGPIWSNIDERGIRAPPALGEGCHGGLACCGVAVRRAATFVVPESECPHPRRADRRRIGLIDATDNFAVRKPRGKGLLGITLRYPYEVRKEEEYFEDIPDEKIPKDMLELASHIVETKSGHFNPEKFEDHYEDALKELLKKKQAGEKIEAPRERAPAKVINLMDALRRSVEAERGGSAWQI
jgi:hypothetical protein